MTISLLTDPTTLSASDDPPAEAAQPDASSRRGRRRRRPPARQALVVPDQTWQDLRQAMLASRTRGDEEVLGFLFCARHRTANEDRYLAKHWVVPAPGDYARQSSGGLALKQAFHAHLLTAYIARGLHMVHVHTHPGEHSPAFSATDDRDEVAQSAALAHLPGSPRLISAVFNRSMTAGIARIWAGHHATHAPIPIRRDWVPEACGPAIAGDAALFDRQRIFGEPVQRQLGNLTVALIGCGGLGAPFAEQLARLGVRAWILVDDDRVELTNLHRLPFSTPGMATRRTAKVAYVAGLIQRFWQGRATVTTLARPIEDPAVQEAAARADLIVVATDNHHSRLLAQQVALRTVRPLLCLGTHIEQRPGEDAPRIYSRVTMPPLAGGWCLACGRVIDLTTAARESADPMTRQQLTAGGYLPTVSAPAVYWVNSVGAAMGVRLVHGALAGFIDTRDGRDDLFDLAAGLWMPVGHEVSGDCFFCSPDGVLAAG